MVGGVGMTSVSDVLGKVFRLDGDVLESVVIVVYIVNVL